MRYEDKIAQMSPKERAEESAKLSRIASRWTTITKWCLISAVILAVIQVILIAVEVAVILGS